MTDYKRACRNVIAAHDLELSRKLQGGTIADYQRRHQLAWESPTLGERGLRQMIVGFAERADAYAAETSGERTIGQDGYWHEHALAMVEALRALLNFECGRFDCGTLDRLILDVAEAAGVEVPS